MEFCLCEGAVRERAAGPEPAPRTGGRCSEAAEVDRDPALPVRHTTQHNSRCTTQMLTRLSVLQLCGGEGEQEEAGPPPFPTLSPHRRLSAAQRGLQGLGREYGNHTHSYCSLCTSKNIQHDVLKLTRLQLHSCPLEGDRVRVKLKLLCLYSLLQGVHPRPLLRHHPEPPVLSGRRDPGSGKGEAAVQRGSAGSAGKPGSGGCDFSRRSENAHRHRHSQTVCVTGWFCLQRRPCSVRATRPSSPRSASTLTCSPASRLSWTLW